MQCQCWDFFILFIYLFSFLLSATLPGNTDSHFTHDLTLWLRIAGAVQLGFSLTGDMLQLGNREVRFAHAHKTKHIKGARSILYICLLLILQNGGRGWHRCLVSQDKVSLLMTLTSTGSIDTEALFLG